MSKLDDPDDFDIPTEQMEMFFQSGTTKYHKGSIFTDMEGNRYILLTPKNPFILKKVEPESPMEKWLKGFACSEERNNYRREGCEKILEVLLEYQKESRLDPYTPSHSSANFYNYYLLRDVIQTVKDFIGIKED